MKTLQAFRTQQQTDKIIAVSFKTPLHTGYVLNLWSVLYSGDCMIPERYDVAMGARIM